jgi:hypothetical protein
MTYKEMYNALLEMDEVQSNPTIVAKINEAIATLEKKSASKSSVDKNAEIKEIILEAMVEGTNYTCTQIMKLVDDERLTSQQKTSAVMNALVKESLVVKVLDKKSTYFHKV